MAKRKLKFNLSGPLFLVLFFIIAGCTTGHCRGNERDVEKHVFVYKPDGSKQCSGKPGKSVESMATELSSVQIYSEESRYDGKLHAQMCGLPTGRINVYEIGISDLSAANKLGFKLFKAGK